MTFVRIRTAAVAAALACLAVPAAAQSSAGPSISPFARLDRAQLPQPRLALDRGAREVRVGFDPEPSPPHLYYSLPLSAALAFVGAAVGYGAGDVGLDCSDEGPSCGRGPDNAEYLTTFAGIALGAASGAHVGGMRHDSRGSLPATLAGAAVGALPLLIADKSRQIDAPLMLSIGTGTAGAVLMDWLARKPRH
jgi:hypothetical protein